MEMEIVKLAYQKMPFLDKTFLAYAIAIQDPLNLHLDIYFPSDIEERYKKSHNYDYTFVSEELGPEPQKRRAYHCHLKGIEITVKDNDFSNAKDAVALVMKRVNSANGWVLVMVSDIDVYGRILVEVYDVITRQSLNKELLNTTNQRTNEKIARMYSRPNKSRQAFSTMENDYHIVYKS